MNRIHAINAGLSFFGLLSVTGYTEVGTLSMGTCALLSLVLLGVFAVSVSKVSKAGKRPLRNGNSE